MAALFWIIVALVLVLTGAIVPVLIFGGWALVVVLVIALLGLIIARALGLLLAPFVWLGMAIADPAGLLRPKYPRPSDPDYPAYKDWANREGEYGRYEHWEQARRLWDEREKARIERERWVLKDRKRRDKKERA